jgi:hypothetical protein
VTEASRAEEGKRESGSGRRASIKDVNFASKRCKSEEETDEAVEPREEVPEVEDEEAADVRGAPPNAKLGGNASEVREPGKTQLGGRDKDGPLSVSQGTRSLLREGFPPA